MKSIVSAMALIFALSISAISVGAQQERESREERQQRERQRQRQESLFENQEAAKQQWIDAMNTAFRAGIEEAPRVRLRSFLEEIEKFVVQIEELYYASVVEEWSQDELDQRSKDIAETTDRLRDFVNFQTEPPQINVAPLPEENLSLRIIRLVNLSHRLIPNIISLAVGGTVGLDQLNQVRDDLAITEALSRSLPESEF